MLTDHVELLRAAFRQTHRRHPFTIDAIVVLPDHLHTVWTFHRHVELGNYPADWVGDQSDDGRDDGER